jgi:hypothetical protein
MAGHHAPIFRSPDAVGGRGAWRRSLDRGARRQVDLDLSFQLDDGSGEYNQAQSQGVERQTDGQIQFAAPAGLGATTLDPTAPINALALLCSSRLRPELGRLTAKAFVRKSYKTAIRVATTGALFILIAHP